MHRFLPVLIGCFGLSFFQKMAAQIPITGYNHVALAVKDIQESAKFYREFVGLEQIEVPEHLKAIRAWFKIAPGQELHLLAGRAFPVTNNDPNLAHFALTISDADPIEAYLKAKNYPYLRQKRFDGAFQIFIADPDGYFIELNEPKVEKPQTEQVASQIPLWPNGAPGFESRKNEPEQAKDWWVRNIHNPSITVFLPLKEKATGAAVLVCPGGGHRNLVYNSEGRDAAFFLNSIGVTAFVLKYRLFREENSPYTLETTRQDAYRAMRFIRSRAAEWGVDATRLGIMGFSAGGEVVAQVAYENGNGDPNAPDPIDKLNGRPDFQILVYPGPLGVPDFLPNDAPPAFMVAAIDDECCSAPVLQLLQKYHAAKIPAEAHIYARGAHAFNMGKRSDLVTLKTWPQRLADWMTDNNLLRR